MNARKLPPKKNLSSMKMLGRQLGTARRAAGLTQSALGEMVRLDEETIASIEQGRRSLKSDLAHLLDEILQTKGLLATGVANLPETDQFPLWAEEYMEQERVAIALSLYANQVLPGLLQTWSYADAVLRERVPAYDREELETKVAARMDRQQILHRKSPPTVSFVVWEPVLHLAVGGPDVRREQLEHLRGCTRLPNLSLQFLPLTSPSHAGLDGPLIILETPDHQHLAYIEGQRGSQWVSNADEVSFMSRKYAMLRAQALSPQESQRLLDRLLGEQ
ncbi:helix-turn-helix transcriptional regulator [Streptomyces longwoodensis]|uniref:helix-turn-helix domain-containing protein n=1 Tax=Streptomyces longwoodensis TaxID=68231 RepID=UPI00225736C0|nr:helix-turn-helix transcriptional regulator [Streptomyces longwoodensis]MCX4995191.1 helix-turn-helix transcriptional regulator [Streptomyces longwoodensis]WUC58528.1 helix-turn-helix transcriptional regulator [Streptomyces longwoodensis]WUC72048.1 helix-turn-helix transcriptional regulator [Streptomyces longwoodensis]